MALMPRGHLTAIRRMAKELRAWVEMHDDYFFYEGVAYERAEEFQGSLLVRIDGAAGWDVVDLSTARFTDRAGRDLMAIQ